MTDDTPRHRTWSPRTIVMVVAMLIFAFFVGFIWQYVEARDARSERDALQMELTWEELGALLSGALIQADNGGHENARRLMSEFFTRLQANLEGAPEGARGEFDFLMEQRDQVITLLSRSDPEAERLLTRMYLRYRAVTGGPDEPIPVPGAVDPVDTTGGMSAATPRRAPAAGSSTSRPG